MSISIATFNVENLFSRPRAMNLPDWSEGQPYLDDQGRLTSLLNQEVYSASDKTEILALLGKYGLDETRPNNQYLELCKIRGILLERHKGKPTVVKANGRKDWIGWVQLKRESISDIAITNTARVIAEVNPHILVLVEVENRPTLKYFHDQVLMALAKDEKIEPYDHIMVIDGNDERGIDVGIMSRTPINSMCSHVADLTQAGKPMFSRDCPEYYLALKTADGDEIAVLPNHFASKGSDPNGDRRRQQAAAVKAIYERIRQKYQQVVVAGDFNDYPASRSLDPILAETDLVDAMSPLLGKYEGDYPGTYLHATEKEKFDYLLLSPALAKRVLKVGVNRRGFYSPRKWKCFENISKDTKDRNQASDHHCLWAEFNV